MPYPSSGSHSFSTAGFSTQMLHFNYKYTIFILIFEEIKVNPASAGFNIVLEALQS